MKINHPSASECRTTFARIRFTEETEHLEPVIEEIVAAYEANHDLCQKYRKALSAYKVLNEIEAQ